MSGGVQQLVKELTAAAALLARVGAGGPASG